MRALSITEQRLLLAGYLVGLIGVLQYVGVTAWLMHLYPGGRLGLRDSVGYDFTRNFLSDLGRTSRFGLGPNPTAFGYLLTLTTAGISTILFFTALSYYFYHHHRSVAALFVGILGTIAGIGYIGVAWHPVNEGYWIHVKFVQWGFIAFWCMTLVCAYSIFLSPGFSNLYGRILLAFSFLLGVQIGIMLRSTAVMLIDTSSAKNTTALLAVRGRVFSCRSRRSSSMNGTGSVWIHAASAPPSACGGDRDVRECRACRSLRGRCRRPRSSHRTSGADREA